MGKEAIAVVETVWLVSLGALWAVVLLNLLLTLRIVMWLRSVQETQRRDAERENLPELPVGEPAPDFRVRELSGRTVRLADYAGSETVLVFVSPHCGPCRREMPDLVGLGAAGQERLGARLVLVSDSSAAETQTWVDGIRQQDKVEVDLPILVAPQQSSELQTLYNPRAVTPYFCQLDSEGKVVARGLLNRGVWSALRRRWEGERPVRRPTRGLSSRFR